MSPWAVWETRHKCVYSSCCSPPRLPFLRAVCVLLCVWPTEGGSAAHVGDGAGDASFAQAVWACFIAGEEAVGGGRRGAQGLHALGPSRQVQGLSALVLEQTQMENRLTSVYFTAAGQGSVSVEFHTGRGWLNAVASSSESSSWDINT